MSHDFLSNFMLRAINFDLINDICRLNDREVNRLVSVCLVCFEFQLVVTITVKYRFRCGRRRFRDNAVIVVAAAAAAAAVAVAVAASIAFLNQI